MVPEKVPLTAHGHKDATRDAATIRAWWKRWPDALVGVACGASQVFVVDCDTRKLKEAAHAWLHEHAEALITTYWHETYSGGAHHVFRADSATLDTLVAASASRIGDNKVTGIDVRGNGGYIIWWPLHGYASHGDSAAPDELPRTLRQQFTRRGSSSSSSEHDNNTTTSSSSSTPPVTINVTPTTDNAQPPFADIPRAVRALSYLDPNCERDAWRDIGWSLHDHFHGHLLAYALFVQWSRGMYAGYGAQRPEKYDGDDACRKVWETTREGRTGAGSGKRVTFGTLLYRARDAGAPRAAIIDDVGGGDDGSGQGTRAADGTGAYAVRLIAHTENVEPLQVVEHLVSGYTGLTAPPGAGKSAVLSHLALCVAAGREFCGRRVRQGPVLYIAAEERAVMEMRLREAAELLALPPDTPVYVMQERAPALGDETSRDMILHRLTTTIRAIEHAHNNTPLRLIVLDTLAASLAVSGAEENGAGMATLSSACDELCTLHPQLALIAAHHPPKDEAMSLWRGHSSGPGALRVLLQLKHEEGESGRTLVCVKSRAFPNTFRGEAHNRIQFVLDAVPTGVKDQWGNAKTAILMRAESGDGEGCETANAPEGSVTILGAPSAIRGSSSSRAGGGGGGRHRDKDSDGNRVKRDAAAHATLQVLREAWEAVGRELRNGLPCISRAALKHHVMQYGAEDGRAKTEASAVTYTSPKGRVLSRLIVEGHVRLDDNRSTLIVLLPTAQAWLLTKAKEKA